MPEKCVRRKNHCLSEFFFVRFCGNVMVFLKATCISIKRLSLMAFKKESGSCRSWVVGPGQVSRIRYGRVLVDS